MIRRVAVYLNALFFQDNVSKLPPSQTEAFDQILVYGFSVKKMRICAALKVPYIEA